MLLRDVKKEYPVGHDNERQLNREINFRGIGWYSMDDDNIYQAGKFATYSRIKIYPKKKKDLTRVTNFLSLCKADINA